MNIVLAIQEMKTGIVAEVNKHANKVPAITIVDTLKDITRQLQLEADKQYQNALKESEVEENG